MTTTCRTRRGPGGAGRAAVPPGRTRRPDLQVCGLLAVVDTMDFAAVREQIGVSDSVLSEHTAAGRTAFHSHVAGLRRITGG